MPTVSTAPWPPSPWPSSTAASAPKGWGARVTPDRVVALGPVAGAARTPSSRVEQEPTKPRTRCVSAGGAIQPKMDGSSTRRPSPDAPVARARRAMAVGVPRSDMPVKVGGARPASGVRGRAKDQRPVTATVPSRPTPFFTAARHRPRGRAQPNKVAVRNPVTLTETPPCPVIRAGRETPKRRAVSLVTRVGLVPWPVVIEPPSKANITGF